MKNIIELREELKKVYTNLKNKKLPVHNAMALNNTASKIMNSVSMEMKREAQTGKKRVIDFIDNGIKYINTPLQKAGVKTNKRKK